MTLIDIQAGDPETGWPPLMDWLRGEGYHPHDVRGFTLDTETMCGTVTVYKQRPRTTVHEHVFRSLPPRLQS